MVSTEPERKRGWSLVVSASVPQYVNMSLSLGVFGDTVGEGPIIQRAYFRLAWETLGVVASDIFLG